MATHPAVHPSADALRAFALGKLNDLSSAELMNHLDSCPDCCKQVVALSGDDFLTRLRQARRRSITPAPASALSGTAETAVRPKASAKQTPIPYLPPELANNPQYEILRELGRGGMGVVYLAKNKLMDRLEVLKVVNKALLDHPGAAERFLREIRSAAKLSHANVVAAYSAVQQGELLAFAMEYVEGQDLASLVKSQGPLPIVNACYYVQQAALGLQHAFEKGMVHRDIKPQNLILAREGKKHIVKVLDFGLAKATREKKEDTGLTGEGKMLGTPDYIAPEQTLDAAKADIRADIYSLGCTLYYLLSGRPPFRASSLGAMLLAHQMNEAKPLNLESPEVPEELAAVVRKMMAKSPAKRYQTPQHVVEALAPFVKQGATQKVSPELSSGTDESKPVIKIATPVAPPSAPAAEVPKQQLEPAAVWESLMENGAASIIPRKSGAIRRPRAATVRERRSPKKWLAGGSAALGVLLLALMGMWAIGELRVKTKDGTIVLENLTPDAEVLVDGETVTVTWGSDRKKAEIHVKPGTHKIVVRKGKVAVVGEEVEIADGGHKVLSVKLEPARVAAPSTAASGTIQPDVIEVFGDVKVLEDASDMRRIIRNGVYSIDCTRRGSWLFNHANYRDGILEVRGRLCEGDGEWKVNLEQEEQPKHGFSISVFGNGQLLVQPDLFDKNPDPTQKRVSVRHAAIKLGNDWNTMRLVISGQSLRVFMNGEEVCEPIKTGFKISPYVIALGTGTRSKVRVEFDQYVLWPTTDIRKLPTDGNKLPQTRKQLDNGGRDNGGFVPIFNGKDLSGWKTRPELESDWKVENGVLIESSLNSSHLSTKRDDYQDFHLLAETRISDRHYGQVVIRDTFSQSGDPGEGYRIILNSTNGNPTKTGSLAAPGKGPVVHITETPIQPDQWFTLEVIAEGNRVVVKVNGKTTADHSDPERRFTRGRITLVGFNQIREPDRRLELRRIEIKEAKKGHTP